MIICIPVHFPSKKILCDHFSKRCMINFYKNYNISKYIKNNNIQNNRIGFTMENKVENKVSFLDIEITNIDPKMYTLYRAIDIKVGRPP